ncbi:ribonuclease activity regulator RraA [Algibacter marinivivus]|uniref:Ribonuclease activity regulator RraA n=1 Tax=Algibacter marinivivus TaxID=2100723 RepID=A0A2U2X314_9FLAO|nr:ribonuclease activity regulator RraA [Algibacter marinivivus]PWH82176.1 ribonuclease activity regulator RraA [Algibacter marinivivus]
MEQITELTRNQLQQISTATIATCLFKKGLKNQFIQNVIPLTEVKKNMVGQAYTLRYIPAREDLNPISVFKNPKHLQRVAVEECPKGSVLVIDSRKNSRAASAGSILVTRLMKRGVSGIVTDGGFRDSKEISELDFNAFHQKPSAPTNLTLHQAIDINVPIGCGDVAVFPGDIIVGDSDGVLVIPAHLLDEVVSECLEMTLYEDFVIEKVNKGDSIIGLYPLTNDSNKEAFNEWKKKQ